MLRDINHDMLSQFSEEMMLMVILMTILSMRKTMEVLKEMLMVIVMVLLSMMKVVLQLLLLYMVTCMVILSMVHIKKGFLMEIFDINFDKVSKLKFKMFKMMNYQQQHEQQHELQHELADELNAIGIKLELSWNQVSTKPAPGWNQACHAENTKNIMLNLLIKNQ